MFSVLHPAILEIKRDIAEMIEIILFMILTIAFDERKLSFLPVSGVVLREDSFCRKSAKVMGYAEKRSGSCWLKYSRPVQTSVHAPVCVILCLTQRISWGFSA